MPDIWIEFKRAFGAVQRRQEKVRTLVDEVGVQEAMLTGLGRAAEANAMHNNIVRLQQQQQAAEILGDTTPGYKDLGTVKAGARLAMRDPVEAASTAGMKQAIPGLLAKIGHHIGQADTRNRKLDARLTTLQQTFAGFDEAPPKDTVTKLENAARTLLNDVLKDSYGRNQFLKDDIPDHQAQAYKDMLKARYNIDATAPLGTRLDPSLGKFYDALTLVPATHVAHTSLRNVVILTDPSESLGDYDKTAGSKRIRVNIALAKQHPTLEYQMGGSKTKVDTFKITTLHEVGHAVDDRAGVMANPASPDFGGWNAAPLTIDDVARAYWNSIASAVGAPHQAAVEAEIRNALGGQPYARPATVPEPDWRKAAAALETCKAIAADTKPWTKARPVSGICYFQDGGTWRSYSEAARNSLTVRSYQWRSPAEWFAEVYAASWMMKKKPSNNVNRAAAIYMYRGE